MKFLRNMKKLVLALSLFICSALFNANAEPISSICIEVSGTATLNIIPDRITVEIGMEEYFRKKPSGDSILVTLQEIESGISTALSDAGVQDSAITVSDMGNYRNRSASDKFKMAKSLSVVVTDYDRLEKIASAIGSEGVSSFQLVRLDNAEMPSYDRMGLKASLDAARSKAEFIASNEGLSILMPLEIIENGPNYYETPSFSNVAYDNGAGMDNMRKIVRRYSVKIKYACSLNPR